MDCSNLDRATSFTKSYKAPVAQKKDRWGGQYLLVYIVFSDNDQT